MEKPTPPLGLLISLLMFPQIVETIYSPTLPEISRVFAVSAASSGLTLSVYFIAFAVGVVIWGRLCDVIGRRYAMLAGLLCYAIGAGIAVAAVDFTQFMVARALAAFGAAVGSIVTQTILRDCYSKERLGKVFAIMGMAISISPVVGFLAGGWLTSWHGYQGVLWLLCILALLLLGWSALVLPETRPEQTTTHLFSNKTVQLVTDGRLWCHAFLVAAFNVMLFSYYSLAPFIFETLGYNSQAFGYSGLLLGLASFLGAMINKKLLASEMPVERVIWGGIVSAGVGAVGLLVSQHNIVFLIPVICVVIGFGLVIPNVLSIALKDYRTIAGTAGAWFGLVYYFLIGLGLWLASQWQNFGLVVLISVLTAVASQSILRQIR